MLHDVPNDRLSADLDQWLGPLRSLLGKSRSEPAGEDGDRRVVRRNLGRLLNGVERQYTDVLPEFRHWYPLPVAMQPQRSYQKEKKRKEENRSAYTTRTGLS
jgi:hypothetical protein